MKEIDTKYIDVLKLLGWHIRDYSSDGEVEICKMSPGGEDFSFYAEVENFTKSVENYYDDFDPDEHAEELIKHRGHYGIPWSIREIIDDADAIKEMIGVLLGRLYKADEK